jgi:hypothetical protein
MDCHYKSGDVIDVTNVEDMAQLKNPDCIIEEGVTLRFYITEQQPSDEVLVNKKPEVQKDTFKPKEVSIAMEPVKQVEQSQPVQAPQEAPQAPVAVVPVQAPPVETHALVGEPSAAPFDINAILTSTGGGGGVAIILAILAVVGGGAGWKFYQKFAEQKHEQEMKKLEIQAQAQGLNGAQPPPCQAANAALEAKLVAIEGKLVSVEKKTSSFSAGFDADDLEERLVKLEKKAKSTAGRPPKE